MMRSGFVDARSADVVVRLDWQERLLKASVRGQPQGQRGTPADVAKAAVAAARRDKQIPQAQINAILSDVGNSI